MKRFPSLTTLLPLLGVALALLPGKVQAQPPAGDPLAPDVFQAIRSNDIPRLNALLDKGAKTEQINWLGITPLLWASMLGNSAACEALLQHGASIKIDTMFGGALEVAQMSPNPKLVPFLLERGAVASQQRLDKLTALMAAAEQGDLANLALLLARKSPVDATDTSGMTALLYASRRGRTAAVQALLEAGAKPERADSLGQTALHHAAQNGHGETVALLLAKGVSVDIKDKKGDTPLLLAARYSGDPATVRALLGARASKTARDHMGKTAAELVQARGYTACLPLLDVKALATASSSRASKTLSQQARQAVGRSLPLIEKTTRNFSSVVECASCHHQGLGLMTTGTARQFGFFIDKALAQKQQALVTKEIQSALPQVRGVLPHPELYKMLPAVDMSEFSPGVSTTLSGLLAHSAPRSEAAEAMATILARQQSDEGAWRFVIHREPLQSSPFMTTALAIRTLKTYLPTTLQAEYKERVARALAWLKATPASSNEDRTYRLLGLRWASAPPSAIAEAARALRSTQRGDGGWAQFSTPTAEGASFNRSDAYATGQALYALARGGGIKPSDPAYKRGVAYLLRTQDEDGSWFVNKRAIPVNNYFDTGFPHGQSQYISYSATCWATLALTLATEPQPVRTAVSTRPQRLGR